MSLLLPSFLYCLGLIPLIVFAYIWGINRWHRYAIRMSSLSLVRGSAHNQSQWRRHLPFGFFIIALISLIIALCQPVITINIPSKQGLIILALDVSKSMCSTDIQPTRLQALEATVLQFIANQRSSTKIGVVAFSDFAELVQPPTNDKTAVSRAIQNLMTGSERAIGDGIYESLDVIAKEEGLNSSDRSASAPNPSSGYEPAVIILVTNGINNIGLSPLDAARLAAERRVRIYTVGLSSPSGSVATSCQSSDPSGFGREYQQNAAVSSGLDVATLKQIAALTSARYFPASGISGLKNVFQDPQLQTILVSENFEGSVIFVGLGAFFAVISFLTALYWNPLF